MLRGGPLAEVQLNCPPRQQRAASKANGRGRRPMLRTPHKTHCPQKDDERVPETCAEAAGRGSGSPIGTKIPVRVPALQPLANASGLRSAGPPVVIVDRGASTAAPVRRPSPTAHAEQLRPGICQQIRHSREEDLDELKARVRRSQEALEQLTEDNGRWLRDGGGSRCSGSNTVGISSTGSTSWIGASGPVGRKRCAHSSARNETMIEVRERLIRADAQLQILVGLEKKAALAPGQTQARQLATIDVNSVVVKHMASDE